MKKLAVWMLLVITCLVVNSCQGIDVTGANLADKSAQATGGKKAYIPRLVRSDQPAPLYSTSYYMLTVDSATLNDMGCKIGQVDRNLTGSRDSVVVLDFGSPRKVGSEYGSDLFWMGPITITQIKAAVQNFAAGYYNCVAPDRQSKIYVGVGTTNYHTSISNTTDFFNHGAAWAQMVNDLNAWVKTQGFSTQVIITGADDIELAWNIPAVTKSWAQGYDSVNLYDYYNYGSLDGCATYSNPNSTICGNGWTREDAWYITYGTKPVWPLPLIYATNGVNAEQWALLSFYSYNTRGYPFLFMGAFTQKQACDQSPGQCPALDNTPVQGWTQLYQAINSRVQTVGYVPWSTDIKWWDGKVTMALSPASAQNAEPAGIQGLYQTLATRLAQMLPNAKTPADAEVLKEKIQITGRILQDQSAVQATPSGADAGKPKSLPKVVNPSFATGLFEGPGGPFQAWEGAFVNHWQGMVGDEFVFVSTGNAQGDASKGVIAIIRISADRLKVTKRFVPAPVESGVLTIESGKWPSFTLVGPNGAKFLLDASKEQIFPGK